ncbi:SIMPL domain-containing protein [bacterium]|nr:SIMPL domain-containing protein [bacterium]
MEKIGIGGIIAALILGIFFITGISWINNTWLEVKASDNSLSVTGSAKKTVTSDIAKWNSSFSRKVTEAELKNGYAMMKSDEAIVTKFLKNNKIEDAEITISPVSLQKEYNYSKEQMDAPQEYTLTQTVLVQSSDISKITNISKNTQSVIDQGVIFSSGSPEYYYSKLPEARVELLPDAMKDAQSRADSIAGTTGKKVGTLKAASVGVVQVLQPNSVDISDYGNYDTSTVEKEVMVTVKASFTLK